MDKNNTNTNETQGYPKLQWSVFVKNGKDMQYVVRADTQEEFQELKTFVLAEVARDLIASGANISQQNSNTTGQEPIQRVLACSVCGAEAKEKKGTGKNGKPYHAIFCSTDDKSHTQWL